MVRRSYMTVDEAADSMEAGEIVCHKESPDMPHALSGGFVNGVWTIEKFRKTTLSSGWQLYEPAPFAEPNCPSVTMTADQAADALRAGEKVCREESVYERHESTGEIVNITSGGYVVSNSVEDFPTGAAKTGWQIYHEPELKSQLPKTEPSTPMPPVKPPAEHTCCGRCQHTPGAAPTKTPFHLLDLDFAAEMCRVFEEGVKQGRTPNDWKELPATAGTVSEYQAKILRHLRALRNSDDATEQAKHAAAIACDANILWDLAGRIGMVE